MIILVYANILIGDANMSDPNKEFTLHLNKTELEVIRDALESYQPVSGGSAKQVFNRVDWLLAMIRTIEMRPEEHSQ